MTHRIRSCRQIPALAIACFAVIYPFQIAEAQAVDLFPDVIVRESDLRNNEVVTNIVPGRTHIRFSNSTANIGTGRLHLIGILPPLPDGSQLVMQRIFRDDDTYWDDTAGAFLYHSNHNHTHFEDWCAYRLREILPGDGVGGIVAQSAKTSFCILDLAVYNSSLPNFNPNAFYQSCGSSVQGLSVGWLDLYSKTLPGQNIDITDVPDGEYWLESEADPDRNITESDSTNNIARIKITIGTAPAIAPDAFEFNDSVAQVGAQPVGAVNSPNLGPTGPRIAITGLSIHLTGNDDYFRFYCAGPGTNTDSVRIDFEDDLGDLDLRLRDGNGVSLSLSNGTTDREYILMTARPAGWYYAQVFGYQGATNPSYTLTINPPSNAAPIVSVLDPPTGVTQRAHGFENYTTTWSSSDPNSDPTWVTVYVNTSAALDGNELLVEASINTPGSDGYHIINSASIPAGTYWVYCEVTDGGQRIGDWSDGQIEFLVTSDSDLDGIYDFEDNCIGWANPSQEPGCAHHGDPVPDGTTDIFDVVEIVNVGFRSGPPIIDSDCPHGGVGRTDLNCDGATDVVDVTMMIDVAFRGVIAAFCNPCACSPYPSSCP